MPNISQQPILKPHPGLREEQFKGHTWALGTNSNLQRLWASVTYIINALSRVDTLANREPEPTQLDEVFFTASDTRQTFVAINGVWVGVGPRRGTVSVTAGATTAAVTLTPEEPDTSYRISLSPAYNAGAVWFTAKATTGFTFNAGTAAPGGGGTVDYMVMRD